MENQQYKEQTEKEIEKSKSFTHRIRKLLIKMDLLIPGPRDVD